MCELIMGTAFDCFSADMKCCVFILLKHVHFFRCGVTPIILLDGGSDPSNHKIKTAFSRLTSKLEVTKKLVPSSQHKYTCLPLLSKTAFVEVKILPLINPS